MTAINQDQQKQQHHPLAHPCTDAEGQPVACEPIASERNHYFTGKLLTARDLRDESNYFLSHSRAHNRLLHGWGVLCGLIAEARPNTLCLDIEPGIALDCGGRELIVHKTITVKLPDKDTDYGGDFLVCLQYTETDVEFLPALYAEGHAPGHREPNRVREGVSVVYRAFTDLPGCWRANADPPAANACADCPESTQCLEVECACDGLIPIARVRKTQPSANEAPAKAPIPAPIWDVETDGRPLLRSPGMLTQICWINWVHGGETKLSSLRVEPSDQEKADDRDLSDFALMIKFNGKIKDSANDSGVGINQYTFEVDTPFERENPIDDPGDSERRTVRLQEDRYSGIYRFFDGELSGDLNIFDTHMVITLRCDFIVDMNGNAVDGNHLGGRRPTGDGIAGGDFVSWTRLVDDRDESDEEEERPQYRRKREIGNGEGNDNVSKIPNGKADSNQQRTAALWMCRP